MGSLRRPIALAAAAAVVVLVLAELAARAVAPDMPPTDRWGDEARAVKAAQLDALAASGCVDVVVAGDSMARDGLVPATITAADPRARSVYNASLDAAGPELVRRWLLDVVVPRVHPATVVLAVSSIDLNERGPAVTAALATYRSAPATRQDLLGRLDRWVGDRSALVANRAGLRDPGAVLDAVGRDDGPDEGVATDADGRPVLPGVIGADGEGLSRRDLTYAGPGPATTFTRTQLLADYHPGEDPAGRVADAVAALQSAGIEVVLVVLPVTADFADLHPEGSADLAAARAAVAEAATRTGAPLVDLGDERWPDDRFADTHHLNASGAAHLSEALPGLARAAGAELGACR